MSQVRALIKLTRWKEHVNFVVALTLLGALLAVQAAPEGTAIDWRLAAVMLANLLAMAYAFMINDIEDAPDDALDPARAAKNPVTSGELEPGLARAVLVVVGLASLGLFALGGTSVLLIGGLTLLLSHLYSWRAVRLKAWPVTDVVSHSLMLSGLLLVAGYFIYHDTPGPAWLVAAAVTLVSVYGQLYNQLRDYDMDKAAGLHNTAIILGEQRTRFLAYGVVALAVLLLLLAIFSGVFPLWLAVPLGISALLSQLYRPKTDIRGSEFADPSARVQGQVLIAANLTIVVWLAGALLQQFQVIA